MYFHFMCLGSGCWIIWLGCRLVADGSSVGFGKPFAEPFLDLVEFISVCKVGEFVGIILVVIELFLAVGMENIFVSLATGGVIAFAPCGDGGAIPCGLGDL